MTETHYTQYQTLGEFLDKTAEMAKGERPVGQMTVEAYILALLVRWQLEDEGTPPDNPALVDTNNDLVELSKEMGDYERGAVMRQLILWISNGDGWLRDYFSRTSELR